MQKNTLSGRQLACITAIYIIGSSSVIGNNGMAKKDTWIALLLAAAVSVPLILLYAGLVKLYPGQTMFDMLYIALGKRVGWIVTLLTTAYCFQLGVMVLRDFPEFVHATALQKTPIVILALLISLVCAYLVKLGVRSFGKAGILFMWIVGIVAILTFFLLISNMRLKHIRPVLATPIPTIALNTAKLLSTPFGETVLLLCLYSNIKPGQSAKKPFVAGLLLGGGYLLLSILRNILVLGAENFSSLYFPSYSAVSTINIGDFFQRVEVMVAGYLLICDILKVSIAMYATCLGLSKLLKLREYRVVALPVALLMAAFSVMEFGSIMQYYHWNPRSFLITIPFQLLIPLILWCVGIFKQKFSTRT